MGLQPPVTPGAAPTAADDPTRYDPAAHVGSPYAPWPLSFPKMLGGIVCLEAQGGDLALTREQAYRMAPVLHGLGAAWMQVHVAEEALVPMLDDAQQAYVRAHKAEFETSRFGNKIPQSAAHPGENRTVRVALDVLEEAARSGVDRPAAPPTALQGMTVFDLCTGVYMLRDDAERCVGRAQARRMLPVLRGVVEPLSTVQARQRDMAGILTRTQIRYIQSHMVEVTAAKRSAFGGGEVGPYRDPLIWHVIRMLEGKG